MKGLEDRARFNTSLVWLSTRMKAQGGRPIDCDPDFQDDYYLALSDVRIERLEWAARHIFSTAIWFPMPADLRAAAMLAPSSVLIGLPNKQTAITEFTEQQREYAAQKLDEILNGFSDFGTV